MTTLEWLKEHYRLTEIPQIGDAANEYAEMLALLKEAHTDAVNDFDSHVEASTDSEGEFSFIEDREVSEEMEDFIRRLAAVIEKAERVQ